MAAPWEDDSQEAAPWDEPVLQVPQGQAVSPQIPYTNPEDVIAQNQAQTQLAQKYSLQDWKRENLRRQFGPVDTAAISAANEIAQPVMGLGGLMGVDTENVSRETQRNVNQLGEARPVASMVGQTAPYLATGPAATMAYMKAVNKIRPGFWQRRLSAPLASSAIPGGIEGGVIAGLNPQQSGAQGAFLSMGGGYAGQRLAKLFSKKPTNLTQKGEEMLKVADDWDIRMMPGAKTGMLGDVIVDDALLKNPKAMMNIGHIPSEQQRGITGKVLRVAGLNADELPEGFDVHRETLGSRYKDLETKSSPVFKDENMDQIINAQEKYNIALGGRGQRQMNELTDKFPMENLTHKSYRGYKNKLNKMIETFSKRGELDAEQGAMRDLAQDYLKVLRNTMRNGVSDPNVLREWDQLDSQFAAMNFLEDNKIIENGFVNYKKLYSAMNKTPRNRRQLHSMTGPWADMAKAANLGKHIEDSTKSTLGAHHAVNKLMGSRGGKSFLGKLANYSTETKLLPDALTNYYVWSKGTNAPWRVLPQEAALFGGNVGSAALRGPLMDRETEE